MGERTAVRPIRPSRVEERSDDPVDQAEDRAQKRALGQCGRPEGRGEIDGPGERRGRQVDDLRRGEDRHGESEERRVAEEADHGRLGLEPAQEAGPDRERHAQVMTVPGESNVSPRPPKQEGEAREQRAENQAVERLERERQLLLIAEVRRHRALDPRHQVFREIEGPEVRCEQRSEPKI